MTLAKVLRRADHSVDLVSPLYRHIDIAKLALARRLHGAPNFAPLVSTAFRTILISLPAAVAAFYCQPGLGGGIGALLDLAVGGIAFAVLAIAGVLLVGDAPMRETLSEAWGSLARRRRAA